MAISKQEVIFEFNAETGNVDSSVVALSQKIDKLVGAIEDMTEEFIDAGDAAKRAAEATEEIGEAAKDTGDGLKAATGTGVTGFKALGEAIKATGLFALVLRVLNPIIDAFLENKQVADAFGVALSAIGVVINDIVDFAISLGQNLFEAFSNPKQALLDLKDLIVENITNRIVGLIELLPNLAKAFSLAFELKFAEAGKVATDAVAKVTLGVEDFSQKLGDATAAVVEYATETASAVKAATDLEKQLQSLSDAERDLAVTTAQSRAEVEELKRQRDDARLSIEQRIASAERAAAIDKAIADENVRISEQRAQLLRQEIELQGATEERLQAVADAEIAAADARTASLTLQTELQNSLFALNQELLDQNQTRLQQDAEAALAEENRLLAERDLVQNHQNILTGIVVDAEQVRQNALREQRQNNAATLVQERDAIVGTFQSAFDAINALQDAFGTENEKKARRNFKIQKALSLTQTTLATVEGVQNAFTTGMKSPITAVFPGYPFVQAGIAAAFGAAQLAVIGKSKFQGGSASAPSVPSGGGGGGAPAGGGGGAAQPPQLDLSFLGEGAGQEGPIRAFVVSENVSNAQQANQKIQEQASL